MGSHDEKTNDTKNIQNNLSKTTMEDSTLKGVAGGSVPKAGETPSTYPTSEATNTISRMFEWRTIKDLFD